ncbi:MAG: cyclodeaminase/cyclohydrolase family protein [Deltaproteobacteria bacterium]|jgi:formiminotetrahydrofolate cyclodeaminase|nr:cyclodeaminase/cyclohydrolase family protein [Deltaproteobacteria bacterium]
MIDEALAAFLKVLDPADNSTGGGTASAVAGAMAAALVSMVARLSLGKPRMESESFYQEISLQAEDLSRRLYQGGTADSQAFEAIREAYRLPKATPAEKGKRLAAIQEAFLKAARTPLENAEACREVLSLLGNLRRRFNESAASDLECAAYLARAGLSGCLANVEINLRSLKEPGVVAELSARVHLLRKAAVPEG